MENYCSPTRESVLPLTRPLRQLIPSPRNTEEQQTLLTSRPNARHVTSTNQFRHTQGLEDKPSSRRKPLPEGKWQEVDRKIRQLYLDEKYSLRVVMEIMEVVYHFSATEKMYKTHFKKQKIGKNNGKRDPKRKRDRTLPKKSDLSDIILAESVFMNRLDLQISPERYKHQERLIISIDNYLGAMFDPRSKGWSADVFGFLDLNGNRTAQTSMWQSLSDQCYGASTLIQSGAHLKAQITLGRFFAGLDEVSFDRDPSIVVKLWRICLELRGIEPRGPKGLLDGFLQRLLSLISEQHGLGHPLYLLVSSLSLVPPEELKTSLRIGYYKTIKKFFNLIGDENLIVLHMLSYYFKYWDAQELEPNNFFEKFNKVWEDAITSENCNHSSPSLISANYYLIYASYYICNKPVFAEDMAVAMLEYTRYLDLGRDFSLPTQAIAFASKLVAMRHRERYDYFRCQETMNIAIQRLEKGGRECRTRAVMLSNTLLRWQREWQDYESAQQEKLRMLRIMQTISEATSPACERCTESVICQKCAARRGIMPMERVLNRMSL